MSSQNKYLRIVYFYGLLFCLLPNAALSQSNFYEGKTVTLIATTSAGGTGDLRVKAMVPFLKETYSGKSNGCNPVHRWRRRPQGNELFIQQRSSRWPDNRRRERSDHRPGCHGRNRRLL